MPTLTTEDVKKLANQRRGRFLTLAEAADHFGINLSTLYGIRAAGQLSPDATLSRPQRGRPAMLYRVSNVKAVLAAR